MSDRNKILDEFLVWKEKFQTLPIPQAFKAKIASYCGTFNALTPESTQEAVVQYDILWEICNRKFHADATQLTLLTSDNEKNIAQVATEAQDAYAALLIQYPKLVTQSLLAIQEKDILSLNQHEVLKNAFTKYVTSAIRDIVSIFSINSSHDTIITQLKQKKFTIDPTTKIQEHSHFDYIRHSILFKNVFRFVDENATEETLAKDIEKFLLNAGITSTDQRFHYLKMLLNVLTAQGGLPYLGEILTTSFIQTENKIPSLKTKNCNFLSFVSYDKEKQKFFIDYSIHLQNWLKNEKYAEAPFFLNLHLEIEWKPESPQPVLSDFSFSQTLIRNDPTLRFGLSYEFVKTDIKLKNSIDNLLEKKEFSKLKAFFTEKRILRASVKNYLNQLDNLFSGLKFDNIALFLNEHKNIRELKNIINNVNRTKENPSTTISYLLIDLLSFEYIDSQSIYRFFVEKPASLWERIVQFFRKLFRLKPLTNIELNSECHINFLSTYPEIMAKNPEVYKSIINNFSLRDKFKLIRAFQEKKQDFELLRTFLTDPKLKDIAEKALPDNLPIADAHHTLELKTYFPNLFTAGLRGLKKENKIELFENCLRDKVLLTSIFEQPDLIDILTKIKDTPKEKNYKERFKTLYELASVGSENAQLLEKLYCETFDFHDIKSVTHPVHKTNKFDQEIDTSFRVSEKKPGVDIHTHAEQAGDEIKNPASLTPPPTLKNADDEEGESDGEKPHL